MNYKFSMFTRISTNSNRVIISNIKTGISTKISKECCEILEQWIELGVTEKQFFEAFEDDGDKKYFQNLVEILKENQMIVNKDLEETWGMKSISVEITHRCNLKCCHCAVSAGTMQEEEVFTTEELKELLKRVIELNPKEIVLTGGEPLVRSDLLQILEYLKEQYNGILTIMTNATLLKHDNVKVYLPYFKSWNISIDGINEETCAAIRGKGVFDKVITAIHLLKREGVKNISLSMVETSENQKYLKEFYSLCEKLNVFPMVREYAEEGRGKLNSDKLKPLKNKINMKEILDEAREIGNSDIEREACYHCGAGENEFYIDYKGNFYPCAPLAYPEYKICNVMEQIDFTHYILSGEYKSSEGYKNICFYTPDNLPKCKECPNKFFCWSCLYDTQAVYKHPETFEKWCQYSELELKHLWK